MNKIKKQSKFFIVVVFILLIIPLVFALQTGFLEVKTLCLRGDCITAFPDANVTLDDAYNNGPVIQVNNANLDFNITDGTDIVFNWTDPAGQSEWNIITISDLFNVTKGRREPFIDFNVDTSWLNGRALLFFDPSDTFFGSLFFDDNFFTLGSSGAGNDILIVASAPDSNIHIASGNIPASYSTTFVYGELVITDDPIGGAAKATSVSMTSGSRTLAIDGNVVVLDGNLNVLIGNFNLQGDLNNNNTSSDANFFNLEADNLFVNNLDASGTDINLAQLKVANLFLSDNSIVSTSSFTFVSTQQFRYEATPADTDIINLFIGTSNSGEFDWMEDEDQFKFFDDILLNLSKKLLFRDADNFINSSIDSQLDLNSDGTILLTAIDTNISNNLNIDGNITADSDVLVLWGTDQNFGLCVNCLGDGNTYFGQIGPRLP